MLTRRSVSKESALWQQPPVMHPLWTRALSEFKNQVCSIPPDDESILRVIHCTLCLFAALFFYRRSPIAAHPDPSSRPLLAHLYSCSIESDAPREVDYASRLSGAHLYNLCIQLLTITCALTHHTYFLSYFFLSLQGCWSPSEAKAKHW